MKMNKKYSQLGQLLISHFKEIIREPGIIFWGIVFPILMSLGLGIAFTQKQEVIRKVAVLETNDSAVLDSLLIIYMSDYADTNRMMTIENMQTGNTSFEFIPMNWHDALIALKRGVVNIIIAENDGKIEYRFDPLNPDAQLSYTKLNKYFITGTPVIIENTQNIQPLTLKGTRYIDFLIPGLLAMGIMMSTMWGLSYGMIEKRSKKLLRRMVATPMKKSYFLISIMTVRMTMNFIEAVLLIVFAWLVFDITIQGSIPALLAIFIAGNVGFAGLAFFISCRTAKTEIGNGLINVVVMPMMILSGIFFSYHNFPDSLIPYLRTLPLTMVADGMRSIFIEGAGFDQIVTPVAILMIGGTIFFSFGLRFFRWY
ncbi:MAG: ABC transporter permease [Bacteroidales bacterium]|nr:ABC transporter permease [Bacteroidales bacterium]